MESLVFSKIGNAEKAIYNNLGQILYVRVNYDEGVVLIYYPLSEPLQLRGDDAANFLADLDTAASNGSGL